MYGADFHGFVYKTVCKLYFIALLLLEKYVIIVILPSGRVDFFHAFAREANN